jgi:hypothetical protein
VHEDYVEHWVRDEKPVAPCWAVFTSDAILLRAGAQFGWADRAGVVLGAVGDPQWTALDPQIENGELVANGVRRRIESCEGDVDL